MQDSDFFGREKISRILQQEIYYTAFTKNNIEFSKPLHDRSCRGFCCKAWHRSSVLISC